jgi:ribulose 1,5-bisphosphate synthetase/thiazole synthase
MPSEEITNKSYWMTTRDYTALDPLQGDIEVDVAVIGGGFTGLTSAYHIKKAEPNLRVALLG